MVLAACLVQLDAKKLASLAADANKVMSQASDRHSEASFEWPNDHNK